MRWPGTWFGRWFGNWLGRQAVTPEPEPTPAPPSGNLPLYRMARARRRAGARYRSPRR